MDKLLYFMSSTQVFFETGKLKRHNSVPLTFFSICNISKLLVTTYSYSYCFCHYLLHVHEA